MDYRLLYDAGNGYEDLDLGDDIPAMNYQIANLNELKDRQAAYSQAIKLPKTARNLRVLGFLDSFAVVADAAYTPRRCKLLCEGAQISPFGAVLYVDSLDENAGGSIECQIVSNTVDLFSILGDVENEQMGNILWENIWTSDRILRDNADASGDMRWPALYPNQGMSTTNPFRGIGQSTVNVYSLVPCYRFITMIEQLFRMYGYRIESDLLDDPYMKSLYITASKITEDSHVNATYTGKRTSVPYPGGNSSMILGTVELDHVLQGEEMGGFEEVKHDGYPTMQFNQWGYYAPQPGDYKLQITIKNTGSQSLNSTRKVHVYAFVDRRKDYHDGSTGVEQTIKDQDSPTLVSPGDSWKVELDVPELNTGNYIGWEIRIYGGGATSGDLSGYTTIDVTAKVSLVHEDAAPGIGSLFDYARATGFKSYKELVQTFMQLFGVLVDVVQAPNVSDDGIVGTIRMYTFAELYRRRDAGQYVDWSSKLVIDNERNVGFSLANYAQRNFIQLTDNTDDGTHDAGSFTVRNRTLQSEKTLFTIAVEAGRDIEYKTASAQPGNPVTSRPLAVVPTLEPSFETDEETGRTNGVTLTYKGCKAHLLRIDEDEVFRLRINTFQKLNVPYHSFPQAVTVTMQELIDRYYTPIKRLMGNARTISAYFNLHALDIAQLDLFMPVWLKPYGCYFYISKINNFIAGQPTKVELVKMSSREETVKYYLTLNGASADISKTIPYEGGTYRFAYSTNGTLKVDTEGVFGGTASVENGFVELVIDGNPSSFPMIGSVILSIDEDPTVVRKINITQEAYQVDPNEIALKLRTDGKNLYVQTSRPLQDDEMCMILTYGSGRSRYRNGSHRKSKNYLHIPNFIDAAIKKRSFGIAADGRLLAYIGEYHWSMKIKQKTGDKYVQIWKANNSHGFGYRWREGLNGFVTYRVAVYKQGKNKRPILMSNVCKFQSRVHITNGVMTQEKVVTETL